MNIFFSILKEGNDSVINEIQAFQHSIYHALPNFFFEHLGSTQRSVKQFRGCCKGSGKNLLALLAGKYLVSFNYRAWTSLFLFHEGNITKGRQKSISILSFDYKSFLDRTRFFFTLCNLLFVISMPPIHDHEAA